MSESATVFSQFEWLTWISQLVLLVAVVKIVSWARRAVKNYRQQVRRQANAQQLFDRKLARATEPTARHSPQRIWDGFRAFRIDRKIMEASDLCSLYLVAEDGEPVGSFLPGQHLFVSDSEVSSGARRLRCYSLSDCPQQSDYFRIGVKRAPSLPAVDQPVSLSVRIHDELKEGDTLYAKAPGGHFFLDESHSGSVVLVGLDTGVMAVLSMLNAVIAQDSARPVWFFYGVRNASEQIMPDYFHRLVDLYDNIYIHIFYSDPLEADLPTEPYQYAERLTADVILRMLPEDDYDFYICGYEGAVVELTESLKDQGVASFAIRTEVYKLGHSGTGRFVHRVAGQSAASMSSQLEAIGESQVNARRQLPSVQFGAGGKVLMWQPTAGSLLEFAEQQGVEIASDCRMGSCHTCMKKVVSGEFEFTQPPFNEPDEGCCLPCICAPVTDMVLAD